MREKLLITLRKRWLPILLGIIGVASPVDIFKEHIRAKIMDWIVERFGGFGHWLLNYPVAFVTLAMGVAFIYLAWIVIAEAFSVPKKSERLTDLYNNPISVPPRITKRWGLAFAFTVLLMATGIIYAAFTFKNYACDPAHYADLSRSDLKRCASLEVKRLRKFANDSDGEFDRITMAQLSAGSNSKTPEERHRVFVIGTQLQMEATRRFGADYDDYFKADTIMLRTELLKRLREPSEVAQDLNYQFPTNSNGIKAVADNLEGLYKRLPD
ncbi:MAG TPA: hypothetical protein VNX88_19140 [Terriglobales bacterium]|jgi:hypothetical protein|nr:hypothetical protein [Terriglobales bacterium]